MLVVSCLVHLKVVVQLRRYPHVASYPDHYYTSSGKKKTYVEKAIRVLLHAYYFSILLLENLLKFKCFRPDDSFTP